MARAGLTALELYDPQAKKVGHWWLLFYFGGVS
jgi:hypothetical protein